MSFSRASGGRAKSTAVIISLAMFVVSATTHAANMTVNGTANIYGAGHSTAPGPGGGGGGTMPTSYSVAQADGTEVLTFSQVTGLVSIDYPDFDFNGPDGGPHAGGSTDTSSYGGVSGVQLTTATMFLVGVFLSDAEPAAPAPPRYSFTGATDFAHLYPQIAQTFFIGDGLTGTGTGQIQQFHVPLGTTRLFLGFSDAWAATGLPGWYDDNAGELDTEFTITPEPCTLLLFGVAMIRLRHRSVRKRRRLK